MSSKRATGPGDPAADRDGSRAPGRTEAAFGWWPSPLSASSVAAGKVGRSGLGSDADAVYWTESRPDLGGRQVVVRCQRGVDPVEVSPAGVSVRSRVHEYGGGQATVADGALFYVDQTDQRWYRVPLGGSGQGGGGESDGHAGTHRVPVALTPEGLDGSLSTRYADGRLTASGRWLISVEEQVGPTGTVHRLVAVAASVAGTRQVVGLCDDTDFVGAPRPSPDGRWLAWVAWDHPAMPWDRSSLMIAPLVESAGTIALGPTRCISGGDDISVGQPRWCRDGALLFIDDRTGWWLPYRLSSEELDGDVVSTEPLVHVEAEFHDPDWVLGQSTVAELGDGSLACRVRASGQDSLIRLAPPEEGPTGRPWSQAPIPQPCVSIAGVVVGPVASEGGPERVIVLGSTPTEAQAVFEVAAVGVAAAKVAAVGVTGTGSSGRSVRLSTRAGPELGEGDASVARLFTAPSNAGPIPGQFFAPASARRCGPPGELPPLVVFCHGGPTASAQPGFDPVVQFFTSRGLAVAVVDYRGSSGYGREYRRRLAGLWGEADIDDCIAYAAALGDAGLVDPARLAIRGTSAGGLTALGALIRSDRFAGAVSWYGVTDLAALAADTHDFESRYVDSLIGPWPEAADAYRDRSPIHHADRISGSVLLLQGADDPVVPPDQSERFATMLEQAGVPCALTVFAGESHGFRRAETIEACLEAELGFYRTIFAGPPGPPGPPGTAGPGVGPGSR
jgi:acetyl esterase/lipase